MWPFPMNRAQRRAKGSRRFTNKTYVVAADGRGYFGGETLSEMLRRLPFELLYHPTKGYRRRAILKGVTS